MLRFSSFFLLANKYISIAYPVYIAARSAFELDEIVSKFQSLAPLRYIYNDISEEKKVAMRWKELFHSRDCCEFHVPSNFIIRLV